MLGQLAYERDPAVTELWGRGQRHDLEQTRSGLDVEQVQIAEHARVDLRRSAHGVRIGTYAGIPKPAAGQYRATPLADSPAPMLQ